MTHISKPSELEFARGSKSSSSKAACLRADTHRQAASEDLRRTLGAHGATNKEHHVCARRRVVRRPGPR
jgi:hypothetical protein